MWKEQVGELEQIDMILMLCSNLLNKEIMSLATEVASGRIYA